MKTRTRGSFLVDRTAGSRVVLRMAFIA